jgi:hypothetical protein
MLQFTAAGSDEKIQRSRRDAAAATPIVWSDSSNVASTARWCGMTLRAEELTRTHWWWAVYDDRTRSVIMDSRMTYVRATAGKKARRAAEEAARHWLERDDETD